jgi:hypothetical protein
VYWLVFFFFFDCTLLCVWALDPNRPFVPNLSLTSERGIAVFILFFGSSFYLSNYNMIIFLSFSLLAYPSFIC